MRVYGAIVTASAFSPPRSWVRLSVQAHDTHVKRVNAPPKVVGFLRALRFPPTGNVDRVGWD
jgi:hypothetical protein